jgi:hypothetical protein
MSEPTPPALLSRLDKPAVAGARKAENEYAELHHDAPLRRKYRVGSYKGQRSKYAGNTGIARPKHPRPKNFVPYDPEAHVRIVRA